MKKFEIALLIALCITFCAGMWAEKEQDELAGSLVRLHVIANSDSDEDQAQKLVVRDQVLALLSPALEAAQTRDDAVDIINSYLPAIEALGELTVTLSEEEYPTREYDSFSLPAGTYLSLRVILGQGEGYNWWCVVFPPLCTEALARPAQETFDVVDDEDPLAQSGLSEHTKALLQQSDEGYEIRFRVVEWWGTFKSWVSQAVE